MDKKEILNQFDIVLNSKNERPYIFRTRLERFLYRIVEWSKSNNRSDISGMAKEIKNKLNYISDQSNQTSDGTLKSFQFLKEDLERLYANIIHI